MKIVWDENKRQANLAKHGLDFADLTLEFFNNAVVVPSHSRRLKGIGCFTNGKVAIIFAPLGREAISLISMRGASKQERKLYDRYRQASS